MFIEKKILKFLLIKYFTVSKCQLFASVKLVSFNPIIVQDNMQQSHQLNNEPLRTNLELETFRVL
jgi:hypothetical protein